VEYDDVYIDMEYDDLFVEVEHKVGDDVLRNAADGEPLLTPDGKPLFVAGT